MIKVKVIDIQYSSSSNIQMKLDNFLKEEALVKEQIFKIDYVYNNKYVQSILIYYEM